MNNFAVTSGGLGDIIERGGAAMATANSSLEQTLALGTAGNEILNNPERVGNGLKTLALRLRGSSVELQAAGEEVDEFVTSTSKMQGLIKTLTGVDIMRSATEYKDVYEILDEIAKVYNSMTDINKASLTEAMFGKNQANLGTAILTNFQTARDVMADLTSGAAQGSATAEYEKWQQSLEAKIAKLGSTFERFSIAIFDDSVIGGAIDGLTGILSVASSIAEVIGSIPSIAGLAGAAMSAMLPDLSLFHMDSNGHVESLFTLFKKQREEMTSTLHRDSGLMKQYIELTDVGDELEKKQNKLKARMSDAARIEVDTDGFGQAALDAFIAKQNEAIAGTTLWKKAWQGLKSVAASAVSMGVNALIGFAVGFVLEKAVEGIYNWINATEIAIEKSDEFFSGLEESQKKMQSASKIAYGDTAKRYAELAQSVNQRTGANVSLDTSEYEEFISLGQEIAAQFPGLISGWDAQGNAVLRLKGNVEELTTALQEEYDQMARGENLVNLKKFREDAFEGAYASLYGKKEDGPFFQKKHLDEIYALLSSEDGYVSYFSGIKDSFELESLMNNLMSNVDEYLDLSDIFNNAIQEGFKVSPTGYGEDWSRVVSDYLIQNSLELMSRINAARYENNAEYQTAWKNWTEGLVSAINETLYKISDEDKRQQDFTGLTANAESLFKNMVSSHYMDAESSGKITDASEYFELYNDEIQSVILSTDEAGESIRKHLNDMAALQQMYAEGALSAQDYKTQVQAVIDALIDSPLTGEAFDEMLSGFADTLVPDQIEATTTATHELSASIDSLTESYTKFAEARTAAMTALASLSEKGYLTPEESKQVSDAGLDRAIKRTQYGSSYVDYETMRALDKALTQAEIDKQMEAITLKTQEAEAAYLALFEAQEEGNLAELVQQQNIIDQRAEEIEQINLYIDALEGSLSALNAFKQAASMGEPGDNFRATKDAIDAISEGLETGRVGTNKFASAVELMFGEQALSDFRSGKISRSDLEKMTSSVGGYYDEDGNLNRMEAFDDFVDAGIGRYFQGKDGKRFAFDAGTTMADVQEALGGVSAEMATYFLDAINEYANGEGERLGPADYLASYDERMAAAEKVQSMAVEAGSVTINAAEVNGGDNVSDKSRDNDERANDPSRKEVRAKAATQEKEEAERIAQQTARERARQEREQAREREREEREITTGRAEALERERQRALEAERQRVAEAIRQQEEAEQKAREERIAKADQDRLQTMSGDMSPSEYSQEFRKRQGELVNQFYEDFIEAWYDQAGKNAGSPFGIPTTNGLKRFLADRQIEQTENQKTVTADTTPAEEKVSELKTQTEEEAIMPVGSDTSAADQGVAALRSTASAPVVMPVIVSTSSGDTPPGIPVAVPKTTGGGGTAAYRTTKVDGGIARADGNNTLVGELAPEIIVDRKTGTWHLADYPQLTHLNSGDIVFNGQQTRAILNGQKTGFSKTVGGQSHVVGKPSNKMLLMTDSGGKAIVSQPVDTSSGKKKSRGGGSSGSVAEKEEKEWYDWIVKALELAKKATEKAIEDVTEKIGHIAKNAQLDTALSKNDSELKKNQAAYERYMKQADLMAKRNGLSSSMVKNIQEGKIDISEYSKDMVEKINQYEEW